MKGANEKMQNYDKGVGQGSHDLLLEFWDPLQLSGRYLEKSICCHHYAISGPIWMKKFGRQMLNHIEKQ